MVSNSLSNLSSSGSLASARWADPDDIFNRFAYKDGDIWLGRNPHNGDQAIGYDSDKHVIVCAGSRSGKGRSFIVNNLALWTGSTVVYDPKGELPVILAARRGEGDQHCEGMGQDVFVLDPLNHSGVDPKYLAYFDPLAGLDPKDGELPTWASRIASSMIKMPEGGEAAAWAKRAADFIALVIMHVMTAKVYSDEERSFHTVVRLVRAGEAEVAAEVNRKIDAEIALAKEEDSKPKRTEHDYKNGYELMFKEMIENRGCRGHISDEARSMQQLMKGSSRTFEGIRSEAAQQLNWLRSAGVSACLTGIEDIDEDGNPVYLPEERRLDPDRLKTDPKGISVFIVMPVEDLQTYEPWLQVVFVGLFAAMRKTKGTPATGKQVLTILDEFSSLGYQEYIIKSLDSIAGSGMKLVTVVQNYGRLKQLYKESMESFLSNSSLELYFGKIGETAAEYVKKQLGETEVVRLAKSVNRSENRSETKGESITFGETDSEGRSDSQTTGTSTSKSWNWNKSVNLSDSSNWGKSDGRNMGRNYGPHVFVQPFEGGSSNGTSLSRNSGGSHTKSASKARGGGKTFTKNESKTIGSSWNHSTSKSETQNASTTTGEQIGGGIAETFHKKPLLDFHEINTYLQNFAEDDRDHIGYPGFMLVRMEGENPTFLRRCNYDQDIVFEKCFTPDPAYEFLPSSKQDILGYQYTDANFIDVNLPSIMVEEGHTDVNVIPRLNQKFSESELLFSFAKHDGELVEVSLGKSGRIVNIADIEERNSTGRILTFKTPQMLDKEEIQEKLDYEVFADCVKYLSDQRERHQQLKIEQDKKDFELKQRLEREGENKRLAEKQKREAVVKRALALALGITIMLFSYQFITNYIGEAEIKREQERFNRLIATSDQYLSTENWLKKYGFWKNNPHAYLTLYGGMFLDAKDGAADYRYIYNSEVYGKEEGRYYKVEDQALAKQLEQQYQTILEYEQKNGHSFCAIHFKPDTHLFPNAMYLPRKNFDNWCKSARTFKKLIDDGKYWDWVSPF